MKSRLLSRCLLCAGLCLAGIGCKRQPPEPVWTSQQVSSLNRTNVAKLTFEEKGDEIVIVVTDKGGRPCVHLFDYSDRGSKQEAITLLRDKQRELEGRQ